MILDLDHIKNSDYLDTDVLIIGAGAVGITMASTLAKKGINVTLLESGGTKFEQKAQNFNLNTVTGRSHLGIDEGRARILGGTTTLWGGQLATFSEIDFMERSWVQNSGWPLTLNDLKPFYQSTAELLSLDPMFKEDKSVWDFLKVKQQKLNGKFDIFLTRWLKETNLFKMFSKQITAQPNLNVIYHAVTTKLSSSEHNHNIDRVHAVNSTGERYIFNAKKVIVACGTIEATRLMLYSGEVEPTLPWSKNENVGRRFQDHLDIQIAKVHIRNKKTFSKLFENIAIKGRKYQPKIKLNSQLQSELKTVNMSASFIFDSSLSEHIDNVKLFLRSVSRGGMPENWKSIPKHILAMLSIFWPLIKRYFKDRRILSLSDKGIYLNLHCEQIPLHDSRITLDWNKLDSNGTPATNLHWVVDGSEVDSMLTFCNLLNEQFIEHDIGEIKLKDEFTSDKNSILNNCRDTNHQCGGLCMAQTSDLGVVNHELKVFGSNNLYIASAAVYPTSSYANSTFTAIALGQRLAQKIINENNK